MRYLLLIFIVVLSGCRTPQVADHPRTVNASGVSAADSFTVQPPGVEIDSTIEELVQQGLANNPGISEARHRTQSLTHRIQQELSLPDPVVNTTTHLSPVETAAGRQAFALGVRQTFVDPARRATRAAIANDEVRAAEAELVRIENELAEKIRVACFQLLTIRETIEITNEDFESLKQIEEVILRQYEVKREVSQQDVLSVQVELSRIENQLVELHQKKKSFSARIARLLNLPPGSTFNLSDDLKGDTVSFNVEQMINQALQARPELESRLADIRKQQRRICLANLQNKPDFTFGLNWIATSSEGISPVADGDDALLLGVGFNLPVYKERIRAAAWEAKEASYASMASLQALKDQIAEEVFDTIARLDSADTTLSLLENDIIPKSERSLELAIAEYSNGEMDYIQLIANWRAVLRYRVSLADIQSRRLQLLAALGRQTGNLAPVQADGEPTPEDSSNFSD